MGGQNVSAAGQTVSVIKKYGRRRAKEAAGKRTNGTEERSAAGVDWRVRDRNDKIFYL